MARKERIANMKHGYSDGDLNADARLSEIAYLVQAGRKIEAIKLYRAVTGASLVQARAAIEGMEVTGMLNVAAAQPQVGASIGAAEAGVPYELLEQIAVLLAQNKKIQAIKLYRERTGTGLAAAKDAIDSIEQLIRARGIQG
jgi:ribosomal protein L7/L12